MASLVGTAGTDQSSAAADTTLAPAWGAGQVLTAGHTLFAVVAISDSSTVVPTCTETSGGWSLVNSQGGVNGTTEVKGFLFWKVAAGSDDPPAFTISAGATGVGVVRLLEWDETLILDKVVTGASRTTSGLLTIPSSGSFTTTQADEVIIAVQAGRGATTDAWSSPITTEAVTVSPNIGGTTVSVGLGFGVVTTIQTAITITNTTSGTSNVKTAFVVTFKRPLVTPTARKVRQSGAWVTAIRKVRQAGAWVTGTRKVRQSGSWV